ncbi:MAG: aldehyde dehydrogenase (NADP(+)) [Fimbriimonadaceae bacterium]|nr:aldehyde dehydrogenase (NADP(+)) [Fimbriimonadaceae bacterium]
MAMTFSVQDRRSGEALPGEFPVATRDDVNSAVAEAVSVFRSGALWPKRAALIRGIADGLEAHAEPIVTRYQAETALPEARARGELARTVGQLRMFAAMVEEGSWVRARIEQANSDRQPIPKPDLRAMLQPRGPVVVFGASNFALAFSTVGGDTASALAAGCPVIVKGHPAHPGTATLVSKVVLDACAALDLPEGVFALLHDEGYSVGEMLVDHPDVAAVGFTGSQRGGLALARRAQNREVPIPVFAEMGSVNPCFLLAERLASDPISLADALYGSLTMGVGQFCTNPGLVFLCGTEGATQFLGALSERMERADDGCMLTEGISKAYIAGVQDRSLVPGVETRVDPSGRLRPALHVTDEETFRSHPELQAEIFGPATLVVRCNHPVDVAEALEGQLTATLQGTDGDLALAVDLVRALERRVGRVLFNQWPTGLEVCPSTVHGGPFPATTDGGSTSVGTWAVERWCRFVSWQNAPQSLLPEELRDGNPKEIWRLVDGQFVQD